MHPGFTAKDAKGETFFLEFDPPVLSGRCDRSRRGRQQDLLGARLQPGGVVPDDVRSAPVAFDPDATIRRPSGERTPFDRDDMNEVLERVAKRPDGTYRVIAGRLIPGKILGNFLYEGTRSDDPNDLVPHQHRRELRALRVFGAWTNLTDLKAANTLDALATGNGRSIIRHYLQDVGSTFGMSNARYEWDLSWERFYQADTTRKRFFSFGFALSPWQTVDTPSTSRSASSKATASSRAVAAPDDDDRLPGDARRRRVLGGAAGGGVHRRHDQGRGAHGRVQRSRGRAVPGRRADQAAAEDRERVSQRREPDRGPRVERGRTPHIRECRRRGERGAGAG